MTNPNSEFEPLLAAMIENRATHEQQELLAGMLRAEPSLRAEYVRQMRLDSLLNFAMKRPADRIAATAPRPRRRFSAFQFAAAALVILCAVPAAIWMTQSPATTPALASVRAGLHAQWVDGAAVTVGTELTAGTWEWQSGMVELVTPAGTVLLIEAPASIELKSSLCARLLKGNLVVQMPNGKSGFVVETPQMLVTDLGTEFGVGVTLDGDSRVQVFDGKVRVESNVTAAKRELGAGESMTSGGGELTAAQFDANRFVRRFPSPKPGQIPSGVLYGKSTLDTIYVAPLTATVVIDADLSEWNREGAFHTACLPPYDRTYFIDGMMMYDANFLYIAAHVGDPEPMRNMATDELDFSGGSIIVRVSTDRELGWPLKGTMKDARLGRKTGQPPLPDSISNRVIHLVMSYDALAGRPRLDASYGFNFSRPNTSPSDWQGAFVKDRDGRGYTLEYAVPWRLLNCADDPPRAGDTLAALWMAHWSDADGRVCRGQLVDVTNRLPHSASKIAPPNYFQNGPYWGKAVYLPAGK